MEKQLHLQEAFRPIMKDILAHSYLNPMHLILYHDYRIRNTVIY